MRLAAALRKPQSAGSRISTKKRAPTFNRPLRQNAHRRLQLNPLRPKCPEQTSFSHGLLSSFHPLPPHIQSSLAHRANTTLTMSSFWLSDTQSMSLSPISVPTPLPPSPPPCHTNNDLTNHPQQRSEQSSAQAVGTTRTSTPPPPREHRPNMLQGGVFFTGGVVMFFDRAMLAMGNVCFLSSPPF